MNKPNTRFCLTRADEGDFKAAAGFRDWLKFRDLGLAEATNGNYNAWITKANNMGGSTGRHYHNYDFQMMYIIKGWVKMYYEGQGEFILKQGDFVYHPDGQIHDFMDYSEDIEILEMSSPADHHSIDV